MVEHAYWLAYILFPNLRGSDDWRRYQAVGVDLWELFAHAVGFPISPKERTHSRKFEAAFISAPNGGTITVSQILGSNQF